MTSAQGYKLLITYNYLPEREMAYRRFILNQWLPAMQALGLEPIALYHTQWGAYPVRLLVLHAPTEAILRRGLGGAEWDFWWQRLSRYVTDMTYCVVPARSWFQFC